MAHLRTFGRPIVPQLAPLVPKPQEFLGLNGLENRAQSAILTPALVVPASRKPKTQSKSAAEWEASKVDIYQLYVLQDRSLPDVIEIMEEEKSFSQSYATRFSPQPRSG